MVKIIFYYLFLRLKIIISRKIWTISQSIKLNPFPLMDVLLILIFNAYGASLNLIYIWKKNKQIDITMFYSRNTL